MLSDCKKLTASVRTQTDRREFWNQFTTKYYNACGFKEGDGREKPNMKDIRKKWSYMLQQDKKKHKNTQKGRCSA